MFVLQRNFGSPTVPCTGDLFKQITTAADVHTHITEGRRSLAAGDRKSYDSHKRALPAFCFMASHFLPNTGGKGKLPENAWRQQSHVVLNGLVMLDFDHLSQQPHPCTPQEAFKAIANHWFDEQSCRNAIMLAHVTPSGDGLRLVCKADPERGNIADNQQHIATSLGMEADGSCINADRISFAPMAEDILFINENIFSYENKEFDTKYGHLYRSTTAAHRQAHQPAATVATSETNGELKAYGIEIKKIVDQYLLETGVPVEGQRHKHLLSMANCLRYPCENIEARLLRAVRFAPYVQDMERDGGTREVEDVVASACQHRQGSKIPKGLRPVLEHLGLKPEDWGETTADTAGADTRNSAAGCSFWSRVSDAIGEPYTLAVQDMEPENRMAGIFAAGGMFCTLLTRCWYTHFDGERTRMNPQVLIIGRPASGKSFADRLNKAIMSVLRAADNVARAAEKRYRDELKKRQTSTKAQKEAPLEQPKGVIRELPVKTSNSEFFTRMENAKEIIDGEVVPLHLYMFDTELDSATRAQAGGNWIDKHDLELKAFANEETGVDFKNAESSNGMYPVFWNTVTTGTKVSLSKKITLRNINDGLATRLAIVPFTSTIGKMIARGKAADVTRRKAQLKEWGYFFDRQKGELKIDRLVDHVYHLCEQSAQQAAEYGDEVLDTLRKRAVFYATWFTVPQIVARIRGKEKTVDGVKVPLTLDDIEVTDQDLRLATVIYEAVIYYQDQFFGQMFIDAEANANKEFVPRAKKSANDDLYSQLPDEFTTKQAKALGVISEKAMAAQLSRWKQAGYLEQPRQGRWKKIIKQVLA